jgi:predicted RNase H-like HicB family nuclease
MQTANYRYWEEDGAFVGYLLAHPNYWTQGTTLEDLQEHLKRPTH